MINPGKYNKKIAIYKVDETENEAGFKTSIETLVLEPYASVKTTRGYTLIASGSDFEKAYTNFTIRFPRTVTITRDMIVKYNSKEYTIEYLNNIDEADIELEMQCKLVMK